MRFLFVLSKIGGKIPSWQAKTYNCLSQCVERLDLAGMDFIWRIAMESPDEDIANEAIQLIITYSYINLNPKMKKVNSQTLFKKIFFLWVLLFHNFSVNHHFLCFFVYFLQDSVSLHKKFIADCYKRLEVSVTVWNYSFPPPLWWLVW